MKTEIPLIATLLIQRNIEQIETRYVNALAHGVEDAVVLIVDVGNPAGELVARTSRVLFNKGRSRTEDRQRYVTEAIEEAGDRIPWNIIVASRDSIKKLWNACFTESLDQFPVPTQGYQVIAVARDPEDTESVEFRSEIRVLP